jgi:DinB family protein
MQATTKLAEILRKAPLLLSDITEEDAAKPGANGKWSKKQELGHLVDSASNNHQRIVRAQLEADLNLPGYDGDRWVALHNYQSMDWKKIIERWRIMNQHLLRAASAISPQAAERKLTVGGGKPITLGFLLTDYVDHLLHHLRHIGIHFGEN